MNHLNSVVLEGVISSDPRLVTVSESGYKLVKFDVASHRRYKDKKGEMQDDFLRCSLGENSPRDVFHPSQRACNAESLEGLGLQSGRTRRVRREEASNWYAITSSFRVERALQAVSGRMRS